jgi:hypothetical protein
LPSAYSGSIYDLLARNADAGAITASTPLAQLGERMRAMTAPPPEAAAPAGPEKPAPAPKPQQPTRIQPTSIALDTASLIAAIGERVSIESDDGRSRIGTLTEVTPETLTIQMRVSGGKANLDFSRKRVRAVIANP